MKTENKDSTTVKKEQEKFMEVYDQTQTTITDQSVQILSMETTEMHSQNETNQEKKKVFFFR